MSKDRNPLGFCARVATFAVLALGLASCATSVLKMENSDEILANKEYERVIEVEALPEDQALGVDRPGAYVLRDAPAYTAPAPSLQTSLPQTAAGLETLRGRTGKSKKGKKAIIPVKGTGTIVTPVGASPNNSGMTVPTSPSSKGKANSGDTKSGDTKSTNSSAAVNSPATGTDIQNGGLAAIKHEPEIEESEGFIGRRPVVDPFRVGEAVTLELSYFGVVAGDMTLEVRPFKQVNGRRAYHFAGLVRSTSVFAMFYAVDDWVETFVDYQDMIPFNYSLHVKESKQLREVRSYFDWKKLRGFVWDKKVSKEKGIEEKNYEWDILPYSHNVFSAPFYLRAFNLEPGKKIQFRVGHEGKNILVTADVLRRDRLSTEVGELDTIVVRPKIEIDGVFKPVGDILFWLTDDDRKFLVRIESKIKIGKIVGQVKRLTR